MNMRYKSTLTLIFLVFIYTLYTILLQIGGSTIGLIPQLFYAFLVGLVASCVISFAMDRGRGLFSIASQPRMLLAVLATGIINNALNRLFLGIGTLGTNPSVASIIQRSWLILVALFTPLALRQKVNKMQMLAILIGFLGLYLTVSGGTLLSFDYSEAPYMGFVLLSAVCSAFITLVMSRYTFNIYGATVLFNLASLVFLGVLAILTHTSLAVSFPPSALFTVVFFGIFGFGIATNLYYYAVKVFGPQTVGNAFLAIPFSTFVFSAIILNTPIKTYYVAAAMLITLGVLLQKRYSSAPERITSKSTLEKMVIYDITGAFAGNKNPTIANQILGGNRALAVKLNGLSFDEKLHNQMFTKRGCIAFTSEKPHKDAGSDEIEFINEIMGSKEEGAALIGIGNPQKLEDAFEEFIETQQKETLHVEDGTNP